MVQNMWFHPVLNPVVIGGMFYIVGGIFFFRLRLMRPSIYRGWSFVFGPNLHIHAKKNMAYACIYVQLVHYLESTWSFFVLPPPAKTQGFLTFFHCIDVFFLGMGGEWGDVNVHVTYYVHVNQSLWQLTYSWQYRYNNGKDLWTAVPHVLKHSWKGWVKKIEKEPASIRATLPCLWMLNVCMGHWGWRGVAMEAGFTDPWTGTAPWTGDSSFVSSWGLLTSLQIMIFYGICMDLSYPLPDNFWESSFASTSSCREHPQTISSRSNHSIKLKVGVLPSVEATYMGNTMIIYHHKLEYNPVVLYPLLSSNCNCASKIFQVYKSI